MSPQLRQLLSPTFAVIRLQTRSRRLCLRSGRAHISGGFQQAHPSSRLRALCTLCTPHLPCALLTILAVTELRILFSLTTLNTSYLALALALALGPAFTLLTFLVTLVTLATLLAAALLLLLLLLLGDKLDPRVDRLGLQLLREHVHVREDLLQLLDRLHRVQDPLSDNKRNPERLADGA